MDCASKNVQPLVGEDIILPRSVSHQKAITLGEFVQSWTISHSTRHAVILRGGRLIASPTVAWQKFDFAPKVCHKTGNQNRPGWWQILNCASKNVQPLVGEDSILPRSVSPQKAITLGEFVQSWTISHSTKHAVILRGGRILSSPTVAWQKFDFAPKMYNPLQGASPTADFPLRGVKNVVESSRKER